MKGLCDLGKAADKLLGGGDFLVDSKSLCLGGPAGNLPLLAVLKD